MKKVKSGNDCLQNKSQVIEITDTRMSSEQNMSKSRYQLNNINGYSNLAKPPHHKKYFPKNNQPNLPKPTNLGKRIVDINCKATPISKKSSINLELMMEDDD